MLRIFRGERHAEGAAQPGQREQNAGAQAQQDASAESTIAPPSASGNGYSTLGTQDLGTSAAPADPPASSGEPDVTAITPPQTASPAPTPAAPPQPSDGAPPQPATEPAGEPQPATEPAGEPQPATEPAGEPQPGFLDRGRMRRRARFLRAARELAYRDLGGLVFDLHRFTTRNDEIVHAKLDTLARIDTELRALETALRERSPVTVLREAGVAACPRCAAIHGSGDRFCPTCGLSVDQAERPIATPNAAPPPAPGAGWPIPAARPAEASPGASAGSPAAQGAPPPPTPAQDAPPRAGTVAAAAPPGVAASPEPDSARAALPAAPGLAQRAGDPPTEVIRSGLKGGDSPQRTVAFDPISQIPTDPKGNESPAPGQDRR